MKNPATPRVSSRKQPRQARSTALVETIVQAATQVLAKEGAARFTTGRVAQKAGVSIGSLYQYFPNKAAILFRLQSDEWGQTTDMLRNILQQPGPPALVRLRQLVQAFIHSECAEAAMRSALHDAAPLYRDAPEAQAIRLEGQSIIAAFMRELLPEVDEAARGLAGELITATLSEVGRSYSSSPRTQAEIVVYADAMADMFAAYVRGIS